MIETTTNIDYLIDFVRIQIGDMNPPYRYTDSMLRTTIITSIRALQRWWNSKYLINSTTYDVYRNPAINLLFPEPPIIQDLDQRPIELMCSIIIKTGSLENVSYSMGSWRDAEVSYSNIEGGRIKDSSLKRDWEELMNLLPPPSKKLAWTIKGSLPGYKGNAYERDTEF
jgi:hypothetical protein